MKFILANRIVIVGVLLGTVLGYAYYHYVGCKSGTCLITGRPVNSSVYGAIMGGLLFSIFKPDRSREKKEN